MTCSCRLKGTHSHPTGFEMGTALWETWNKCAGIAATVNLLLSRSQSSCLARIPTAVSASRSQPQSISEDHYRCNPCGPFPISQAQPGSSHDYPPGRAEL